MRESDPPPSGAAEEGGSFVVRFGTAVGIGALAALASALPATLRVASLGATTAGTIRVWVALAAAGLGPMVAAVVVLRGAREGTRAFAGPGAALRAFGVGIWLSSLLFSFTFFGRVLRATTHHHGLAGVTFAFGGLAIAIGSALVCARIVGIARGSTAVVRRGLLLVVGTGAILSLAYVGMHFVRGASQDAASYGAAGTAVDVLAFALTAVFASGRSLVGRRALALVGPPVAVIVAALGVSMLRDPALQDAIRDRAPAFGAPVDLLSGR